MKKILILFTILIISFLSIGCVKDEDNSARIRVYETYYNGLQKTEYPNKIFTTTEILDIINKDTSLNDGSLSGRDKDVLYLLKYYDEEGKEVTVMVMNDGKISIFMIGLIHSEFYVKESVLLSLIDKISQR